MDVDLGARTSPNGTAVARPQPGAGPAGPQQRAVQPVDLTRVLVTAEVVLGAVIVADRLLQRPASARARVVMGPGGWVSMKGGAMSVRPSARLWRLQPPPPAPRPWWAKVLSAKALQTLS